MTPPLLASAGWRQALVASLYGYQGVVAGFALTAIPNHVAGLGAGVAELGTYAAAIGIPWVMQPLWGPVVDRFGAMRMGRRRFWVLAALAGSLLAMSCLLWVDEARPGGLPALALIFAAHALFAALMDTATDAMIIDHTPEAQLGAATASTRAGFVTGLAAGGGLFAWLLPAAGLAWSATLLICVGALAAVLPLMMRERAGDAWLSWRCGTRSDGPGFASLLAELGRGMAKPAALALLVFCVAQEFIGAIFRLPLGVHLIQQAGWSAEAVSSTQAVVGVIGGTVGAWLTGRWADKVGPAHALGRLLAAAALAHLLAGAALGLGVDWAGPVALALPGIASALCFVALAPAVMRASRGAVAASRFALFMAALNLGDVLGAGGVGVAIGVGTMPSMAMLGVVAAAGYVVLAFSARPLLRRFEATPHGCHAVGK